MNPFGELFAPTECVLLDNAVECPTPLPVAEALRGFSRRLATVPSRIRDQDDLPALVSAAIARLFEVPAEWVSLTTSTTEGITVIARSIALDGATRVLVPANEYPATVVPWLVQERAGGARVHRLACDAFEGPPTRDLLVEISRPDTSAVSLSAIGWQGIRHDLRAVARACADRQALLVIDASQATGAIRLPLRELDGACVSTTFSKWAFGPEGVGAVVLPDVVRERMSRSLEIIDLSAERPLSFTHRWPRAVHAGSPAPIALAGVRAGLDLIEQLGLDAIESHGASLAAVARDRLREMGYWVAGTTSAIVCFRPPGSVSVRGLFDRLREHGVFLSLREDALRASFHIHNDAGDIDRMCRVLGAALA